MMSPFESEERMGKVVVVTGCSSGFGRQVSEALAGTGNRVYATMREVTGRNSGTAAELNAWAAARSADLRTIEMDVTSNGSVEAAAEQILRESGAPDVVINNAGQMFVGITEAFSPEELLSQLDVNVVGVHRVSRAFLPAMRARGTGLLINISSIAGRLSVPFNAVYHASKWALEGYSIAMRAELASSGIDLVLVEPGPFTTALFPTMRLPLDADGRGNTYPPVVHETFAAIGGMFDGLFSDPAIPTDPALVVDRLVELVEMPPGSRPLRSVVGVDFGVAARNGAVEVHDAGVLDAAGLSAFATLRVSPPD
jgi:NAD(P)-dependent dehydrogenase (short-subunit alcohol dehydrogenase family)